MQLTMDTEAPIDIDFKMSTINEDTLNTIITNTVVESFSKDVTNSEDIVKDVTSKLASSNDKLQNFQVNFKVEQDDASTITTTTTESEKVENIASEETTVDDCESKSLSPPTNENEINKTENIVNNDTSNQQQDLESQKNINKSYSDDKENVNKTETSDILGDNDNKLKSNFIISESKLDNQIEDCVIIAQDLEDTTNDCVIDKKDVTSNDIENNGIKESNNDTNNLDIKSTDSHFVINEVSNETEEKKEQSSEDVNQSQCVPLKSNQNKAEKEKIEVDLTLENSSKDISMKEKEIPKEGKVKADTDTKNSPIEILEEEKTDETERTLEMIREKVDSKLGVNETKSSLVSKLSNILDILSDDEEERHEDSPNVEKTTDKQCISLVDDDDVMLIDEDTRVKVDTNSVGVHADEVISETCDETTSNQIKNDEEEDKVLDAKQEAGSDEGVTTLENNNLDSKMSDIEENITIKPLLPLNFLNTCKKKLTDMTREDLEDFCSLKIVESVMDRSNLGDLKTQLKTMTLTIEEFKKKTTLLAKQNRDLQVVLKSIQEEQKRESNTPIIPLKITRSVGMQVLMSDKPNAKRKNAQILNSGAMPTQPLPLDKSNRNTGVQKVQKTKNQPIPVPRLVPAANTINKSSNSTVINTNDPGKSPQLPPVANGLRNSPPTQKPEKRSRLQSVTVDLTDDEPPMKVTARTSPAPGVRLVPAQSLLPPQRPQFATTMSSPRKVYIPISGPQSQNVRPGQTVVLKPVPPNPVPRPRMPANNNVNKMQSNSIRMNRALPTSRHPAPLPDAVKQYQPTSWKALPPAPDLKLSKVENGIVISWKIDGYQEDSYEEIISYQLFAYQETNSPPSTALWKKIGDVKALPLPMACTLTQFLAGYKYYFAVRAVDIKSRFGPFSLPASILLLNKM